MSKKQIKDKYNINYIKLLINQSIIHYTFQKNHSSMPDEVFKLFLNSILLDGLDDYSVLSDKRIRSLINWNKIPRKKLIRLFTRDTSIIQEIDFEKLNFTILELENFLKFHPEFIEKVSIDFENITARESIIILSIDKNSHHYIDFDNINFNRLEMFKLVKKFIHEDDIITKLDFTKMDNFIFKHIIKKTNNKYLNKIDLKQLNVLDWLDILQNSPSMFQYCNLDLFTAGDCYYLTKLAYVSSEEIVFDLINKHKESITSLGWQNLLMLDLKKYSPICNWAILKNLNFKKLKSKYPDIENYKISTS